MEETAVDRVLATVLFTDIVDSTAQAAALGDAGWREVRERHDQVVRAQLGRFRGLEIKTIGDGFLGDVRRSGPGDQVRSDDRRRDVIARDPGPLWAPHR
jgi:class 3 adenylate cyclase